MCFYFSTDYLFNLNNFSSLGWAYIPAPVSSFLFPGGEVQTRLDDIVLRPVDTVNHMTDGNKDARILIVTRLTDANKIMELGQLSDILHSQGFTNVEAYIPFIPYMQQDRPMTDEVGDSPGYKESFALAVFAEMLNTFRLKTIYTIDPHSNVTNRSLINGLKVLSNQTFLYRAIGGGTVTRDVDYLVSPDEGAVKKTLKYSKMLKIPYIVSFKQRDPLTGKIVGVNLPREEGEKITGKTVMITDDICIGGATFVELAKELRKYNPKKIRLFVTHGIFSKGTTLEGIDEIFCTNSCRTLANTSAFTQYLLETPDV